MKKIKFDFEDIINLDDLERLYYERNRLLAILNRLFIVHMNDSDLSFFESKQYKTYYKKLYLNSIEVEIAQNMYSEMYFIPLMEKMTGKENISFTWEANFHDRILIISYKEE